MPYGAIPSRGIVAAGRDGVKAAPFAPMAVAIEGDS